MELWRKWWGGTKLPSAFSVNFHFGNQQGELHYLPISGGQKTEYVPKIKCASDFHEKKWTSPSKHCTHLELKALSKEVQCLICKWCLSLTKIHWTIFSIFQSLKLIASGSADKTVKFWSMSGESFVKCMSNFSHWVVKVRNLTILHTIWLLDLPGPGGTCITCPS